MTDAPAPLRAQTTSAAREPRAVVPLNPADPAAILAARAPAKPRRGRMILWIGGGLVAAQVLAPPALTPTTFAGGVIAQLRAPMMLQGAAVQEQMAHANLIAQRLADLEARYSEARSKCFWGALMGPEAGDLCTQLVDANFVPAIQQLRAQLGQ